MFGVEKGIEDLQQLFVESKKYLELQTEYAKLELTEKLTILLSTLILVLILIILGMVTLFLIHLSLCACPTYWRPDEQFCAHHLILADYYGNSLLL